MFFTKNRPINWAKISQMGSILLLSTGLVACSSGGNGGSAGTPPTQIGTECTRTGAQAARDFDTNATHNTTGTGCTKSVPILSDAPSNRDATPLVTANADGKTRISAHVFVPAHTAGQTFPVVLHSHGWSVNNLTAKTPRVSGNRDMFAANSQITSNLVDLDGGYIVVSFDQRGWGQSEGEIAVMAPERETQDAKAIIDWVAAEGKAGRLPVQFDDAAQTDPRLGTIGVSYGGGFQFLLAAEDPRVDTIVPFGTWHDLIYSLTPHRYTNDLNFTPGVFKHAFVNGLCALGVPPPSTGNRDDVLINACTAAPTAKGVPAGFREVWDASNTIVPFGQGHGMRWYQNNVLSSVSVADSKSGFAPRAGFDQRGAVPTLLWQGSRDVLFNYNEAMWNFNYLKSLSPTVEVKLLSNGSGHMSTQWAGQTVDGSNCGRFTVDGTIRAWFKKYLKNQPADWAALNVPDICMNLNPDASNPLLQYGVSLPAPVVGGTVVANQTASVTAIMMGANAYVFLPVGSAIAVGDNSKMLAGVPRLTNVSVCAPAPAGCSNNAVIATESLAFVGVGVRNMGGTVRIIDDQVFPIRGSDANGAAGKDFLLPGIAEQLVPGDQVGLLLFPKHPQYDLTCIGTSSLGPFPACNTATLTPSNYFDFTADVELPIVSNGVGGAVVHSGLEP